MLRLHRKSKGFTLIELMIVVAILGILAVIAIPRFAVLIDRAKESRTQGNLGCIRSAVAIYNGANSGTWPTTLGTGGATSTLIYVSTTSSTGAFMTTIPLVMLPSHMGHTPTNAETTTDGDTGEWFYDGVGVSTTPGTTYVNCTHTDSTGVEVDTW
jgi:prepilin-type N-terminal cleavage/methylation domain-containing protein